MSSTSLEKSSAITKRLSPFSSPSTFYPLESVGTVGCLLILLSIRRRFMRDISFSFVFFPSFFFFFFLKEKERINWSVLFFYFVQNNALILIGICIDEYLSSQYYRWLEAINNITKSWISNTCGTWFIYMKCFYNVKNLEIHLT